MGLVFISYSSKNKEEAEFFKAFLNRNNIKTWIAPDDIPAGSNYPNEITQAIESCSCLLLLLTPSAVASPWVPREVEMAINSKKPVIPVKLEEVTLTKEFRLYIGTSQILPIYSFDEHSTQMQRLLAAVQTATGHPSAQIHTENLQTPQSVMPLTPKKNRLKPLHIVLVACVVVLVFSVAFASLSLIFSEPKMATDGNTFSSMVSGLVNSQPQSSVPGNSSPINQIPENHQSKVTALQYADDLTIANSTIRVPLGGYASVNTAWPDIVIYSQDTGIAVGEGLLIKGVSKGTTYIVVTPEGANKVGSAYYVIVE